MIVLGCRSGRHLWRRTLLERSCYGANGGLVWIRTYAAGAVGHAVDVKKTRNIGIIAHIDAVSLHARVTSIFLIISRGKLLPLSVCSSTVERREE
jgi:hypothetical protein